jgi:hypothetical protein
VLSIEALREKALERRTQRMVEDWIAREQEQQADASVADQAAAGSVGSPH